MGQSLLATTSRQTLVVIVSLLSSAFEKDTYGALLRLAMKMSAQFDSASTRATKHAVVTGHIELPDLIGILSSELVASVRR